MSIKNSIEHKLARKRSQEDTNRCYRRVFGSPDGRRVLADLRKRFGMEMPAFLPHFTDEPKAQRYDPLHAAIRDGQRQVLLHVQREIGEGGRDGD